LEFLLEVFKLETGVKKLYEVMFLIDSAEAAKDWDGIIELVTKMLNKIDAQILSLKKWDERPLAYSIKRCSRGTYILAYFRADGRKITELERDVLLSERVMRALILRVDHLTEEDIAKQAAAKATAPAVVSDDTVVQDEPAAAGTDVADNFEQQV
jgi:small subunit ribosomal protein S6